MTISKFRCHELLLPRWDIYICDDCGRYLAGMDTGKYSKKGFTYVEEDYKEKSIIKRFFAFLGVHIYKK